MHTYGTEILILDIGNMTVYTDIINKSNGVTRTFESTISDTDLLWHRDQEDRTLKVVGNTDWKIQLDNELPKDIDGVKIEKYAWHRLIKGTGKLVIEIIK
jgi:hypothetical protein